MKTYALALILAAGMAAPAFADQMASPTPSPGAMSGHMTSSGHMKASPKPSPHASGSMSGGSMSGDHMMAAPKPSPSSKP